MGLVIFRLLLAAEKKKLLAAEKKKLCLKYVASQSLRLVSLLHTVVVCLMVTLRILFGALNILPDLHA